MPPRKKTKAEPSAQASTSGSSSAHPEPESSLGQANGYGMEDEEMGWASLGKPLWKGKGLSDEIKTVEVRSRTK